MLVIAGTYRILGAQPDGDSIRFYPDDVSEWDLVKGPHSVRTNAKGGAQLRLDGIDALETHYAAKGGVLHQPLDLAHDAANALLDWVGFRGVSRTPNETVTDSRPERVRGYIVTRGTDLYGRCVAFAGRGKPPGRSGTSIHFDRAALRRTANYRLAVSGHAFPSFYFRLFPDLRDELTKAVKKAGKRGIWKVDRTSSGVTIKDLGTLTDKAVILPKLFRRLVDYIALNDGGVSLGGFRDYLAARDDRLFILSTGHWTGFDTIVSVERQRVRLTRRPEDLVFMER